jgi:hypothetical protein
MQYRSNNHATPRFSGLLVARRHIDLLRVNSALCI